MVSVLCSIRNVSGVAPKLASGVCDLTTHWPEYAKQGTFSILIVTISAQMETGSTGSALPPTERKKYLFHRVSDISLPAGNNHLLSAAAPPLYPSARYLPTLFSPSPLQWRKPATCYFLPVSINGRLITVDSMLFISWQVKFVSTPKGSVQTSNVHNIETKAQIFRCRRTFCSVSDVSMLKYKRYVHPRDVPNSPSFLMLCPIYVAVMNWQGLYINIMVLWKQAQQAVRQH